MSPLHFDFSLPTPQSTLLERNRVTLLLVDDDAILRELMRMVLTLAGYTVLTAPDGATAQAVAERNDFGMLITDFQMPGMDGCTLARQLRKEHPALPVLVMSGAALRDLPSEEISRQRWSFLSKPFDKDRMLSIIDEECLTRPKELDASVYRRREVSAGSASAEYNERSPPLSRRRRSDPEEYSTAL